tara:strand:- start:32718 stop:33179 length:462 start_codon:yes stop_codon:yes gene_type:complete
MNLRGKLSSLFSLHALVWLTMLTGLAALLCIASAAWLAMAPHVGAPLAALYTGVGLLVVAVLLGWAVKGLTAKPDATSVSSPRNEQHIEQNLTPLIGERAAEWTQRNAGVVMIGAVAAGVLIAASPGTRRFLTRAAGPVVTRKVIEAYQKASQ